MAEELVPIFKVTDVNAAVDWYSRLGFVKEFEHRYSEEFPAYVGVRRDDMAIHFSEHVGDATPDSLVYLFIDDVDALAKEFDVAVEEEEWAREIQLTDPDGNRLRIGTRTADES